MHGYFDAPRTCVGQHLRYQLQLVIDIAIVVAFTFALDVA
jgi:hypothetical protein